MLLHSQLAFSIFTVPLYILLKDPLETQQIMKLKYKNAGHL